MVLKSLFMEVNDAVSKKNQKIKSKKHTKNLKMDGGLEVVKKSRGFPNFYHF